jgi:hypothetical protein
MSDIGLIACFINLTIYVRTLNYFLISALMGLLTISKDHLASIVRRVQLIIY